MTEQDIIVDIGGDIEAGTYTAELVGFEPFDWDDDGEVKHLIRWQFAIGEAGSTVEMVTDTYVGVRNKFRKLLVACGVDASKPGRVNLRDLVGSVVMITVILNADGFSKVDAVVPAPRAKGR